MQVHAGLAVATKSPELMIDADSAENLGAALVHLSAQYGGKMTPKQEAWLRLTIVAASIYGPRVMKIRERQQKEAEEKKPKNQSMNAMVEPPYGIPVQHPYAVPETASS